MPTPSRALGVRPELELLLCCARVDLDPGGTERITALLRQNLDWPLLTRLASFHGMMPLLYWHLNRISPDRVPATIRDQLREHFHSNARHNLLLTGELLKILKLFDNHGISAIPIKGPTLAAYAYGNVALREFGDLDVLVRCSHFAHAKELLLAQGYQFAWPWTPDREKTDFPSRRQLPLVRPEIGCMVELHSHFTFTYFPFPVDLGKVWDRSGRTPLCGTEVPTLGPEDLVLYLCVHGSKHLWACLGWVCDLALVLRVQPCLDWRWIVDQSRILRSERMVLLSLLLAHDLLQAPLPPAIVQKARANSRVKMLEAYLRRRFFAAVESSPTEMEHLRFMFQAREYLTDGLGYVLSRTIVPTEADWKVLTLPTSLSLLYYPFRPIRLAYRLGRHLVSAMRRADPSNSF